MSSATPGPSTSASEVTNISLDELTAEELQAVWVAEAERRYEAVKTGRLDTHPGPEVHNQILDEIK